jgi:Caspase domain
MANQTCISIGINQYQFLPALGYGMADATAMEQFFVDAAGWDLDQCLLLTDTSPQNSNRSTYPDRENINRWIKKWSWDTLHHGDLLWFFFSGCGVSVGGEDYLVPIDGRPEDIANTCISIRQLYQQFHDIGVNALVFLDANHSQHLSLGDGIGQATAKLAQDYQIPTFLSCQSNEFSHEDAGLGHGLFTTALLEALNYHPDLNLETIDTYLTSRLAELSEHHWKPLQTPVAILPPAVSVYRPVFSATTQTSISTTIPEVVYTPPTRPQFGANDTYEVYTPPSISISIPAEVGTGVLVRKPKPAPRRKNLPNWARVSFLLTLMIGAGGAIYAFKAQSPTGKEQPVVRHIVDNPTNSSAPTTASERTSPISQARKFVMPGDATSRYKAILAARQIAAKTPAETVEIQQSIELWSQEIYQIAQGYANDKLWQRAIDTAKMVPRDSNNYLTVQSSMSDWRNRL